METVFVVGGDAAVCRMFQNLGWEVVKNFSITTPALICFTGGADVQPHLYGEHNVASYVNPARDEREMEVYTYCKGLGVPMVGICRGGQFLNVMEGGKMYQDVDNHTATHYLTLAETGEQFKVTSTHHQMMRPAPHGKVLAVANLATHRVHGSLLSDKLRSCTVR
jgi:gamma-glutamyl-gamma-aminobutyrate hydrolase PuuD